MRGALNIVTGVAYMECIMIDSGKLAKKMAKLCVKYRARPNVALEASLYHTFAIASMMGLTVDDIVELIEERKEELDGLKEDDACAGDTKLDARSAEPMHNIGGRCQGGGL